MVVMRGGVLLMLVAGCGRFGFDADDGSPDPDASPTTARLTIEHNGGDGVVVGPAGFTCNTGTCTLDVDPGTTVNLRGLAAAGAWFAGWTGPCGGNFDCELVVTADVSVIADFTATPNRVFVTSTDTDGAFGGLAGGDAICATRAAAAGLTGTFIAYLSDSTTAAPSRIAASRGWVRTDGAPVADSPGQLLGGSLIFPPRLDELGNDLEDAQVYTGTDFGDATVDLCGDWTIGDGSSSGSINEVKFGADMPGARQRACSFRARLLCVEIGRVVPVETRADTGRQAFVTANKWTPGGGRASADAHCASEATLGGLTGNFLAAIATSTETIKSRFDPTAVYRRVDGVRLLRGPGLFTASWMDVPPQLDQFGAILSNDLWTGTNRFDTLPAAADTCNDWTVGTAALDGLMHYSTNSDLRSAFKTDPCDSPIPLLCLEN